MTSLTNSQIITVFNRMRIKHPRLEEVSQLCEDLRSTCSEPGPKTFASCFAPTHSGKTTAFDYYIEKTVVPEAVARGLVPADLPLDQQAKMQKLVVHVTLEGGATPRSLCADILTALGDPRSTKGSKSLLLRRVYDLLSALGVELLIVDEIQHLAVSKHREVDGQDIASIPRQRTSEVTDTLKSMLIRGIVPMVFVGIEEARDYLLCDQQLALRCFEELDFGELNWDDAAERQVFVDFVGRIGLKLEQEKLFESRANFLVGDIPACLHKASKGRLGVACKIVAQACRHASKSRAKTVDRDHLAKAVDTFAIPRNIVRENPFKRRGDAELVPA